MVTLRKQNSGQKNQFSSSVYIQRTGNGNVFDRRSEMNGSLKGYLELYSEQETVHRKLELIKIAISGSI